MRIADVLTPDTTTVEQFLTNQPDFFSDYARQLLESGRIHSGSSFADLDRVMREDFKRQSAVAAIKAWFEEFNPDAYSVAQAETAIDYMLVWMHLDPDDFAEHFS
jgi:hypothetical protein